jgi:hypothetical protein
MNAQERLGVGGVTAIAEVEGITREWPEARGITTTEAGNRAEVEGITQEWPEAESVTTITEAGSVIITRNDMTT